jgi:hypothetical protein
MRIFKFGIMMAIFTLLVSTGPRANAASNLLLNEVTGCGVERDVIQPGLATMSHRGWSLLF